MVSFLGLNFGKKSAKRFSADYSKSQQPIKTDEDSISLKDFLSTDPDLAANVRRFVDNVLIASPEIISADDETLGNKTIKTYNKELKDVRFYKNMRAALYNLIWNGNAFFEIKFSGKKLKELYNIDPGTIEIIKNNNDEVTGYIQRVDSSPIAKFTPEEIVHISIDHLDTGEWGHAFMKPLKQTLLRKSIAEHYLQWLIQKNKFAPIISVKSDSLSDEQWSRILQEVNYKAVDADINQVINMGQDESIELIYLFTTADFDRIQSYIDRQNSQIIALLQVPPIISGTVDNSNRSNSEIQANFVFYNTIRAFQNLIKEELDFEMLRKLNWNKAQFKFPIINERVNTDLLKLAKSMKVDLNFTQEAIEVFLKQNGFKLPQVTKLFEEVEIETESQGNKDLSGFPSREPRSKTGIPENEALRTEDKQMGVSKNEN